jgi:hypothetical protein
MGTSERKGKRSQLGVCKTEDYCVQDGTLNDELGKPKSIYIPQKAKCRMANRKKKKT